MEIGYSPIPHMEQSHERREDFLIEDKQRIRREKFWRKMLIITTL